MTRFCGVRWRADTLRSQQKKASGGGSGLVRGESCGVTNKAVADDRTVLYAGDFALECWRRSPRNTVPSALMVRGFSLERCTADAIVLRTLSLRQFDSIGVEPEVIVGHQNRRTRRQGVRCRCLSTRLAPGSVCGFGKAMILSPEACFVESASDMSFIRLVELGLELCGTYSLDWKTKKGFRERTPLTSAQRILRLLDGMDSGVRGIRRAKRALAWVRDGSASPKESQLIMALTLPTAIGGFGMPVPQINYPIPLGRKDVLRGSPTHYRVDLYWPEVRVSVEYQSDSEHTGDPEKTYQDQGRRDELLSMGVRQLCFNASHMRHASSFEKQVERLSALIHATFPERGALDKERFGMLLAWLGRPQHMHPNLDEREVPELLRGVPRNGGRA